MNHQTALRDDSNSTVLRLAPLAGVAFAALSIAGNLAIGAFPGTDTPVAQLTTFYATHTRTLGIGAMLLSWAAIVFGLFGVAIWARVRDGAHPLATGLVLAGTAVAVTGQLGGAATYALLGDIGADPAITPPALQAWHVGSFLGGGAGTLMLLGVFAAGVNGRALPRWMAWTALVLGIGELTPSLGFYASMLMLLWAAGVGIMLWVRRVRPATNSTHSVAAPSWSG